LEINVSWARYYLQDSILYFESFFFNAKMSAMLHADVPNSCNPSPDGRRYLGTTFIYLFIIYLLLCIIKSRQMREMKYNTKRIAEVQKK